MSDWISSDIEILHPAALLALSNQVLMQNVRLGPWIHVESELRHFSLAVDGEQVAAGGERAVQLVRHTAIYEPHRGTAPGARC